MYVCVCIFVCMCVYIITVLSNILHWHIVFIVFPHTNPHTYFYLFFPIKVQRLNADLCGGKVSTQTLSLFHSPFYLLQTLHIFIKESWNTKKTLLLDFENDLCLCIGVCVSACVCAHECRCPWRSEGHFESPWAGVTGSSEPPDMGLSMGLSDSKYS